MKVKEYEGHKVPEGATHYQASYQDLYAGFYKKVFDSWFFFNCSNTDGWVLVSSADDNLHGCSIELPEQPMPSKAEWVPVVGKECEVMHYGELLSCKYIGKGIGEEYVYQIASGSKRGVLDRLIGISGFRKPKTAEEKKREAFKAAVSDAIYKSQSTYYDRLEKISCVLFDAGFTAPEGE